jgi:hypothetical protein
MSNLHNALLQTFYIVMHANCSMFTSLHADMLKIDCIFHKIASSSHKQRKQSRYTIAANELQAQMIQPTPPEEHEGEDYQLHGDMCASRGSLHHIEWVWWQASDNALSL